MRAEGRKAGIWKPQQQKRYNITTICFSLHHQENMHRRYLLESTLRFPMEGGKKEATLGKGRSPAMVQLWRWLQHVSWRALELERTFSIVARLCIAVENEQALGDGEGPGSLACCSPWVHKESDMTEQLNSNEQQQLRMISAAGCL